MDDATMLTILGHGYEVTPDVKEIQARLGEGHALIYAVVRQIEKATREGVTEADIRQALRLIADMGYRWN